MKKILEDKRVLEVTSEGEGRKDDATCSEMNSLKSELEGGQKIIAGLKKFLLRLVKSTEERAEGHQRNIDKYGPKPDINDLAYEADVVMKNAAENDLLVFNRIDKYINALGEKFESLGTVTAAVEGQLSLLSLALQNKEAKEQSYEARTRELEAELIQAKAQLDENNAELERTTSLKNEAEKLVNELEMGEEKGKEKRVTRGALRSLQKSSENSDGQQKPKRRKF